MKVEIESPASGNISAQYNHTIGPRDKEKNIPYKKINTIIIILSESLSLFYYKLEQTPTTINTKQHMQQPGQSNNVFLPNLLVIAPQTNENIVINTLKDNAR